VKEGLQKSPGGTSAARYTEAAKRCGHDNNDATAERRECATGSTANIDCRCVVLPLEYWSAERGEERPLVSCAKSPT
jgi:hypothetical protein